MAIIENTDGGEGFNLSNLALSGLTEYVSCNATIDNLRICMEEAREYGYLTLDTLPPASLQEFSTLTELYQQYLQNKEDRPIEYVERFADLVQRIKEWFPHLD